MLGQHRSTQRHRPRGREDEERLVADMIELTRQYGRYGYRRIAALLRDAGWQVNDKRIERLWRREGLKVPIKQPKKGRLWLNDGSCVRLRTEAAEAIRALIEEVRLVPDAGSLKIELYGELAALINLANEHPRSKGTGVQVTLVAGARCHLYRTRTKWRKRAT